MSAPNELIENFTVVEPSTFGTQAAADAVTAAGFFGAKPPENPPITDTVTPVKQPVQTGNG